MQSPKLPPVPMAHAAIGLLVGVGVTVGLFYQSSDLPPGFLVAFAAMLPFILYYLWSNRAPGGMFVERKAAPMVVWARRFVTGLMVLAFLLGQPRVAEHAVFLVVAVALLVLLLATPRWGPRYPALAWAIMMVQFDLPAVVPGLFLLSLIGVLAFPFLLRAWRARPSEAPRSR